MELVRFNTDGCLSYLLFCPKDREALVIDPTFPEERFLRALSDRNLTPRYIIDTHTHADHASAGARLAALTGAPYLMHEKARAELQIPERIPSNIKQIIENNRSQPIDRFLQDKESFNVGRITCNTFLTPGHTPDSISLKAGHLLFTGDFLLVNQCGRTDLPGGSSSALFKSIFAFLLSLRDDTVIYPSHDYQENINTVLGYEKVHNPFLQKRDLAAFQQFAGSFFPPLDTEGGKLQCSITGDQHSNIYSPPQTSPLMQDFCFHLESFIRESPSDFNAVSSTELFRELSENSLLKVIDVREPQELVKDGYIKGALPVPLRQLPQNIKALPADRETPLVTVCRSGSRSAYAAMYLRAFGYRNVRNLEGGMLSWISGGYPVTGENR